MKNIESTPERAMLAQCYENVKEAYREQVFYGDRAAADALITTVATQAFGEVDAMLLEIGFDIYLDTWLRIRSGSDPRMSTPSYIKEALAEKFEFLPTGDVERGVDASLRIIFEHEPELEARVGLFEEMFGHVNGLSDGNGDIESRHMEDSDYGLVREKPVFVAGFGEDRAYLARLRTPGGERIDYTRLGCTCVDGIAGLVDMYDVQPVGGGDTTRIYLCNYGKKTSDRPPVGFRLV